VQAHQRYRSREYGHVLGHYRELDRELATDCQSVQLSRHSSVLVLCRKSKYLRLAEVLPLFGGLILKLSLVAFEAARVLYCYRKYAECFD